MIKLILQNIPALIVTIPMFFAPIIAMISSANKNMRYVQWQVVHFCVGLTLAGSAYLFAIVYQYGALNYFFGAWPPPQGIEYEATKLNTLLMLLISFMAFVLLPYGKVAVEAEINHKKTGLFYAVFLMLISGLMGMVITNDIFNIFVFLEISSLATYALVALGQDRRALTASFNYLIIGTIGGTFFLIGIAFLYVLTGSLNISDIAYQLGQIQSNNIEVAAIAFLFIGVAIKCAIVPLAGWLPRVYQYSPSFVVAFISSVSTKVALYVLAKIFYVLFGKDLAIEQFGFGNLLVVLAVIAIIFGGVAAIMQMNFKRMLAFSSISNIGYIVMGIGLGSKLAVAGAILLFISHAFAKAGLFVVAGLSKNNLVGLKESSPILAAFLLLFGLCLVGMPLTIGFVPKWYLLIATAHAPLAFFGLVAGSVLAAIYVWKIVEVAYFTPRTQNIDVGGHALTSLFVLAAAIIILGIYPQELAVFVSELAGEFAK